MGLTRCYKTEGFFYIYYHIRMRQNLIRSLPSFGQLSYPKIRK